VNCMWRPWSDLTAYLPEPKHLSLKLTVVRLPPQPTNVFPIRGRWISQVGYHRRRSVAPLTLVRRTIVSVVVSVGVATQYTAHNAYGKLGLVRLHEPVPFSWGASRIAWRNRAAALWKIFYSAHGFVLTAKVAQFLGHCGARTVGPAPSV